MRDRGKQHRFQAVAFFEDARARFGLRQARAFERQRALAGEGLQQPFFAGRDGWCRAPQADLAEHAARRLDGDGQLGGAGGSLCLGQTVGIIRALNVDLDVLAVRGGLHLPCEDLRNGAVVVQARQRGAQLVELRRLALAGGGGQSPCLGASHQLADDHGHDQEDHQHHQVACLVYGQRVIGFDEEIIEGKESQRGGGNAWPQSPQDGDQHHGQQVEQGDDGSFQHPAHGEESRRHHGHQQDRQEIAQRMGCDVG